MTNNLDLKNSPTYKSYTKSPYRSIKHSTYFESYDHFFAPFRGKDITFVEIGVFGGGSLFMWRDYFGPKARIIGIDLDPNAKKWEKDGFEIYIGSQSDVNFWNDFKTKVCGIDVVLDDGGHSYEQQIITTECLLDAINDGGLLVVEDTHTSYMDGFGTKKYSFIEYVKNKIDSVNTRFGETSHLPNEKRFWSIEIVESMVAFKVNHTASNRVSEPTDNGGKPDNASDFRYEGDVAVTFVANLKRKYGFFKHLPFVRFTYGAVINFLVGRKFSAKKYFD